ncbi:hypothetical protein AAT19DRAFT_16038 [Rhodotorula toruloides]|uniref:Uncharacterized protein n=1 Tax=Rhodotorula toruloides TaxID=5286 RepID=A0A2T0A5J8_RHOTO|nr:hypothetical protein AAT19DRAFT_16038 [Rhodotorula toruloides]
MYNLFSTSLTVPGDARVPVVAKVTNDGTGSLEDLLKEHEAYKHINGGIHGLTPTHFGAYFHDPNTFNLGMKAGLSLLTYEGIQLRTFASLGVEQTTAIYSAFVRLHNAGLCHTAPNPSTVAYNPSSRPSSSTTSPTLVPSTTMSRNAQRWRSSSRISGSFRRGNWVFCPMTERQIHPMLKRRMRRVCRLSRRVQRLETSRRGETEWRTRWSRMVARTLSMTPPLSTHLATLHQLRAR